MNINIMRANCDKDGNSRYVFHFMLVPFRDRLEDEMSWDYLNAWTFHAKTVLKGQIYRGKDFGGGIVCQTSEPEKYLAEAIA